MNPDSNKIKEICRGWRMLHPGALKAALFDMDGTLYDSMRYHADAWYEMMQAHNIPCCRDEFFLYEGMTGKATINHLFARELNRTATEEEVKSLYAEKTALFKKNGKRDIIRGADKVVRSFLNFGVECILVTGSGQASLLETVCTDFPGAFEKRVTALDVTNGKPHPEPYLKALQKGGVEPGEAIVIENAPLGVESGVRAGIFTIAVLTGPIPREEFVKAGANLIFESMEALATEISAILNSLK